MNESRQLIRNWIRWLHSISQCYTFHLQWNTSKRTTIVLECGAPYFGHITCLYRLNTYESYFFCTFFYVFVSHFCVLFGFVYITHGSCRKVFSARHGIPDEFFLIRHAISSTERIQLNGSCDIRLKSNGSVFSCAKFQIFALECHSIRILNVNCKISR